METKVLKQISEQLINNNINIEYCTYLLAAHLNVNQEIIGRYTHMNDNEESHINIQVIPYIGIDSIKGSYLEIRYVILFSNPKLKSKSTTAIKSEREYAYKFIYSDMIKQLTDNVNDLHKWNILGMPLVNLNFNVGEIMDDLFRGGYAEFHLEFHYYHYRMNDNDLRLWNKSNIIIMDNAINALMMLYNYCAIANQRIDFYYGDDYGDFEGHFAVIDFELLNGIKNNLTLYTTDKNVIYEWHSNRWNQYKSINLIDESNKFYEFDKLKLINIKNLLITDDEFQTVTGYLFDKNLIDLNKIKK